MKARDRGMPVRWDYGARWDRIREELARKHADAFVVRHGANIRYLACAHLVGNPPLSAVIIPLKGSPVGIASSLEASRARAETAVSKVIVVSLYRDVERQFASDAAAFRRLAAALRLKKFLADSPLPGVKASVDGLVSCMREVKDACEIDCIRRSARLADLGAAQLKRLVWIGRSELAVAADLEFFLRRRGAQCMSYPTIIAAGPHSSYSHHVPTTREIRAGDAVICDFGVYVDGYASDITRTILVGRAARWKAIYRAVKDAQAAAAKRARLGVQLKAVDAAARDLLRRRGLAKGFVHSTGHGMGLDIHEGPSLSPFAKGRCRAGMVMTLEPAVYLPGQGGVRIEDDILITAKGAEWLTGDAAAS